MLSYDKKKTPESTIKLPNPTRVEKTKPIILSKKSFDNLAEMNNFDAPIACTPPDRGFMDNLMRRMERT